MKDDERDPRSANPPAPAPPAPLAREDVTAIVAHELSNYLATISASANALLRTPDDRNSARKRIEAIQRAATRMRWLVTSLVDVAALEHGMRKLALETEPVAALVADVVAVFEPEATDRSQQLIVELPAELPELRCDREQTLAVIANLVVNALKFTPAGGRIQISARRSGDDACISVSDDGTGISREDLPHVFDRYWRGAPHQGGGSGLGLYISRAIVEAHGGTIWADSEPGQGATVSFTLPLALD